MKRKKKNYDWKRSCFDCCSFCFGFAGIDSVDLDGNEEGFEVDGFWDEVAEHCASPCRAPIDRRKDRAYRGNEKEARDNAHWVGNPNGEGAAGRIHHDSGVGLLEAALPKRLRRGCCSSLCLFVSRRPVSVSFYPRKKILL